MTRGRAWTTCCNSCPETDWCNMHASAPLALFGGTFDPVHYGHLRCADEVRHKLELETLYLLPSGKPPHRASPAASARQRLDMLQLATSEFPGLKIDTREIQRDGPSYMVETLHGLRESFPYRPLLLLIGQDVANQLHSWYCWKDLFDLTHIIIMSRPDSRVQYLPEVALQIQNRSLSDVQTLTRSAAGGILKLQVSPVDISATAICNLLRQGQAPEGMLPDTVLRYIVDHGLYIKD